MRSSSRNGKTDNLLAYAEAQDIPVYYGELPLTQSLSVCANGKSYIAIDPEQVASSADGRVKIAHELGHCKTGSFYTRYSKADVLEKHEYRADKWAVHRLMPLAELEEAVRRGYTEPWQLAEYFDVTEAFVHRALDLYAREGGAAAPQEELPAEENAPYAAARPQDETLPPPGLLQPVSPQPEEPPVPTEAAAVEAGASACQAASKEAVPAQGDVPITTLGQLLRYMVDCEGRRGARKTAARRVNIDIQGERKK